MTQRIIAVDWSGDRSRSHRKIWLAEMVEGRLARLERGRNRDALTAHLIKAAQCEPQMVVGLDFAFSLPAWYMAKLGLRTAVELWDLADRDAEQWLRDCAPPFWGRPGRRCPELPEHFRRTERHAPATGGIRPKSVFQIGGAGAVGTGSLRGMQSLKRLREAGFHVWPFDPPGLPLVVEIYPRLLTGPVDKRDPTARESYLSRYTTRLSPEQRCTAGSCEDAFDAAISAFVMSDNVAQLSALDVVQDSFANQEGVIWAPTPS